MWAFELAVCEFSSAFKQKGVFRSLQVSSPRVVSEFFPLLYFVSKFDDTLTPFWYSKTSFFGCGESFCQW